MVNRVPSPCDVAYKCTSALHGSSYGIDPSFEIRPPNIAPNWCKVISPPQVVFDKYFRTGGDVNIGKTILEHDDTVAGNLSDDGGSPRAADRPSNCIFGGVLSPIQNPNLYFA